MMPVGVVIRTRNSARYVSESVQSVLDQSLPPTEVVVVDYASTDGTLALLETFKPEIRVIPQQRKGLAGAAQDGVDALSTPLLAFQDSDDIWPLERTAQMVQALEENPEFDGVMGRVAHFISPELSPEEAALFDVPEGPQPGAGLPSLLVRRDVFKKAGELLDGLSAGEYFEWLDRIVAAGLRIEPIDALALHRRVHLNNFTRSASSKQDYLRAVRTVMARRRSRAAQRAD